MPTAEQIAAAYEARVAAVPEHARRFAEETWGETWAHAEMGSLLDFAKLLASQPAPVREGEGFTGHAPYTPITVCSGTTIPPAGEDLAALSAAATPGEWCAHLLLEMTAEDSEFCDALVNAYRAGKLIPASTQPAAQGEPVAAKPDGCILCCNGAELPPGEYCRACGRVSRTDSLLAALNKVEGRNVPPTTKVAFASPTQPAATGRPSVEEVRHALELGVCAVCQRDCVGSEGGSTPSDSLCGDRCCDWSSPSQMRQIKRLLALLAPDRGDGQ